MVFNPFDQIIETREFPLARIYRTTWRQGIVDAYNVFVGNHSTFQYEEGQDRGYDVPKKQIRLGIFDYLTFGIPLLLDMFSKKYSFFLIISVPLNIVYYSLGLALSIVVSPFVTFIHTITANKSNKLKNRVLTLKGETGLHDVVCYPVNQTPYAFSKLDSLRDMERGSQTISIKIPETYSLKIILSKLNTDFFNDSLPGYAAGLKEDNLYIIEDGRIGEDTSLISVPKVPKEDPRFRPCRHTEYEDHLSYHPLLFKLPIRSETKPDESTKQALKSFLALNCAHVGEDKALVDRIKTLTNR